MNNVRRMLTLGTIAVIALVCLIVLVPVGGFALMEALAVAVGVVALAYTVLFGRRLVEHRRQSVASKDGLKMLVAWMVVLYAAGVLTYMYVFSRYLGTGHWTDSNFEYLFRSLVYAAGLFVMNIDGNLMDNIAPYSGLRGWLSLLCLLCFICTIGLLVGLVYTRLKAYLKLRFGVKVDAEHPRLYLFFGINKPTELLADDVARNDPQGVIVLVDRANMAGDDEADQASGISSLLGHRRQAFIAADQADASLAIAAGQLFEIPENVQQQRPFDAFAALGIERVARLMRQLPTAGTEARLRVFFLSENSGDNLKNLQVLLDDATVQHLVAAGVKIRIYLHARHQSATEAMRDMALRRGVEVQLVDSSSLAMEQVKAQPQLHPAEVAHFCPSEPTVDRPLETLIVGFGEVGHDAFRFLYEFGALVDARSTEDDAWRVPFRCTIVDSDTRQLPGQLQAAMPAIFGPKKPQNVDIQLARCDHRSTEFYSCVLTSDRLQRLNYVVIALPDSMEAMTLAIDIFNAVRAVRTDLSDLRILVRCADDDQTQTLRLVADHYNHGYGAAPEAKPVINIFGNPANIFTYKLIIEEEIERQAQNFYANYCRQSGDTKTWEQRRAELAGGNPPSLDKLRSLRRKESQDRANAMHALTKRFIAERFVWMPHHELMLRLAQLEHLRWNASHELLGYLPDPQGTGCDERQRRHNCLVSWKELDGASQRASATYGQTVDYKSYDFMVVRTSLENSEK